MTFVDRVSGIVLGLVLITMVQYACTKGALDEATTRAEIIRLHNLQRACHMEKRADDFAEMLSQDHISVNGGGISHSTREENQERFTNYFDAVEFEKWDDREPLEIRFSDDYSMAYTAVAKDVIIRYSYDEGDTIRESIEYAWVAIYKRIGDAWTVDCVASTNKESVIDTLR